MTTERANSVNAWITLVAALLLLLALSYHYFAIQSKKQARALASEVVIKERVDTVYITINNTIKGNAAKILPGISPGVSDTNLYQFSDSVVNLSLWTWRDGSRVFYQVKQPQVIKTITRDSIVFIAGPGQRRPLAAGSRLAIGMYAGRNTGGPVLRYATRAADYYAAYDLYQRGPSFGVLVNLNIFADRKSRNLDR